MICQDDWVYFMVAEWKIWKKEYNFGRKQHAFLQQRISSMETSSQTVRSWAHLQRLETGPKHIISALQRAISVSELLNTVSPQLWNSWVLKVQLVTIVISYLQDIFLIYGLSQLQLSDVLEMHVKVCVNFKQNLYYAAFKHISVNNIVFPFSCKTDCS